MKFNQRQKDAIAKVFENIGTANIIALLVGAFIESKVPLFYGIALWAVSLVFISCGVALRKGD